MPYNSDEIIEYLEETNIQYANHEDEAFDSVEDYDTLFEEFTRLAKEDTVIEWIDGDNEANSIEFKIDGVSYEFTFPRRTDYIQIELFAEINNILSTSNNPKNFILLDSDGEGGTLFVYGDNKMLDEFKERKWLSGQKYSEMYGDEDENEN